MALITSAASGNFNAGATWTGGVVPTTGDEARAATGHTVTINVNTTCDEISNAGTGKFVLADGVTLTANVTNKSATAAAYCLEFQAAAPATANIIGNCTGGTVSSAEPCRNTSSGTLNVTGNVSGGTGGGSGITNNSTGTLNVTGNVSAGTSGSTTFGIQNITTGIVNVTGNVTGGTGTIGRGVVNNSTGTINITGNATAGSLSVGAFQNSTGTLSIIGTLTASQGSPAVAGANVQQVTVLSGPFITETTRGVNPVYCAAWRWNASPSNSTYLEVMTNTLGSKRNLYTADNITGMPDEADVKDGVTFGPSGELTGTLTTTMSPSAEDIRDAVWGAATSSLTTAGSIGERLKNTATVASTGDQLASALTAP